MKSVLKPYGRPYKGGADRQAVSPPVDVLRRTAYGGGNRGGRKREAAGRVQINQCGQKENIETSFRKKVIKGAFFRRLLKDVLSTIRILHHSDKNEN